MMNERTLDLLEILREFPDTTINVRAGDLAHFARQLLDEAMQESRHKRAVDILDKGDELLTSEMVKGILQISDSTLYRLAKAKILTPIYVGRQKRFKRSDIFKLQSPGATSRSTPWWRKYRIGPTLR